jgi:hypothetical protein
MAARDRSTYEIGCASCGAAGTVEVSENNYAFMKKLGFTVDVVKGPFKVIAGQNWASTKITCECGKRLKT